MSDRKDSFKDLVKEGLNRGTDVDRLAAIRHSWQAMAQAHCQARNEKVGQILRYAILIRNRYPVHTAGTFAAEWQIPREIETAYEVPPDWAKKIDEYGLSEDDRKKITAKFVSTQDAHILPCELKLSGKPLEVYLSPEYGILRTSDEHLMRLGFLRLSFGAVDRLPTLFNESDSHAERVGFKRALLEACMSLSRAEGRITIGWFKELHRAAFATWLRAADIGLATAITRNEELRDKAKEKTYERLYRDAKLSILRDYRRFTASEVPAMSDADAAMFLNGMMLHS